jgi:hypothetical protein
VAEKKTVTEGNPELVEGKTENRKQKTDDRVINQRFKRGCAENGKFYIT